MAKINGIEIKALKTFKDHEGCTIAQGNLYLGGKKIGFWSQDYMNGPDMFDLDRTYDEEKLNKKVEELNFDKRQAWNLGGSKTYIEYGLESLLYDLITLKEEENFFKKQAKKIGHNPIVIVAQGVKGWTALSLNAESYTKLSNEQILNLKEIKNSLDEMKESVAYKEDKADIFIFKSLKDFDIGKHIKLGDIMR